MPKETRIPGLGLTTTELKSIDSYRKRKNTAVLTIMFTDIQGFTALTEEKGESYVHTLHAEHDRIVVECIEKGRAGIVIKYIGDAVMAIFSEPTAAVERALLIQQRLYEFNRDHPELDDLKVRIGLHMGQTVIENKMHVDLFGRHVNKASRMEGLAEGGQVFISYPVFDSVKSWLIETPGVGFKFHGAYYLKGITKPEDVYEVFNQEITVPRLPRGGKKRRSGLRIPVLIAASAVFAGLVITGALLLPGFLASRKAAGTPSLAEAAADKTPPVADDPADTVSARPEESQDSGKPAGKTPAEENTAAAPERVEEVLFADLYAEVPILDFSERLLTARVEGSDNVSRAMTRIDPGRHVIHFVVSDLVWYFAEFEVKPGKNLIPLEFIRTELPEAQINLFLEDVATGAINRTSRKEFAVFNPATLARTDRTAEVRLDVAGEKVSDDLTRFTITCTLIIDGNEAAARTLNVESPMGQKELTRSEPILLWEDPRIRYDLKYHFRNESIQVNVDARFREE